MTGLPVHVSEPVSIRELDVRFFGEESVWETALFSPFLPQAEGTPCLGRSHGGEDTALSQAGLVPALLPTLRIYDLSQITSFKGLVFSSVKWG